MCNRELQKSLLLQLKHPPSVKGRRRSALVIPPVTMYRAICPIPVPVNVGNPSSPTVSAARHPQGRNSGVIFCCTYLHRASTVPGSLLPFCTAYCLHHSFFLVFSIIVCTNSICQALFPSFTGFYLSVILEKAKNTYNKQLHN